MSDFDVAVGISEDQMNAMSQSVYQQVYPNLFKGSQTVQYQSIAYIVKYDVQAPPQFDLMNDAEVQQALQALAQKQSQGKLTPVEQDLQQQLLAHIPTFKVKFPQLAIELVKGSTSTHFQLDLTAYCHATVNGDRANLAPFDIIAAPTGNLINDWMATNVVVPQIMAMTQTLLSGIQIPPLSFSDVHFSNLALAIVNKQLVAVANLAFRGTPAFPSGRSWPQTGFFAMLSQDTFQAAANGQHFDFADHDKRTSWGFGGEYSYNFQLVHPRVTLRGTDLRLAFDLVGSIRAAAYIPFEVGLCYSGSAMPAPGADCALTVEGTQLVVTAKSLDTFTVLVTPCGSISDKISGWILEFIVQGIVGSATLAISSLLKNIRFTSFDIPTYPVSLGSQHMTISPSGLRLDSIDGYLALQGGLQISR